MEYLTRKEKELISRVIEGENEAFKQIIEDYKRLVSHMVYKMISNQTVIEDLSQEIFIKVYKNLPKFQQNCKLSSWIGRIAYNHCLNFLEKKKMPVWSDVSENDSSYETIDGNHSSPQDFTESMEIKNLLKGEIDKLSYNYKVVLTLYHLEELKYEEIARIMKLPVGTIKSYLFRARKQLKENLLLKYDREDLCA